MVAVKRPCDPKWKPAMHEYPTGSEFKDLLPLKSSNLKELYQRGLRHANESSKMDNVPVDMITMNRNSVKRLKPQVTKRTEDVFENICKNIIKELKYSFSLVSDFSEDCFTLIKKHQLNESTPEVNSPLEMSEKDISKLEVCYVAKDVTENLFVKLESTVVDMGTASTSQQGHKNKGAFNISGKEQICKQPKQLFLFNRQQPTVTFVSQITEELIHTVSNKLEAFAVSKQTCFNITQMTGIRHPQTSIFNGQIGSTTRNIVREVTNMIACKRITQPDDLWVTPDLEREEMKQKALNTSSERANLFNCIADILKSILGSILKELDQDNNSKTTKQKMFPLHERQILLGLVTTILNDINALGSEGEGVLQTVHSEAAGKEILLQDFSSDHPVPAMITSKQNKIIPRQSVTDQCNKIETPPVHFAGTVISSDSGLEESSTSIHISSSSATATSQSSETEISESKSLCENTLHDIEVIASKKKIRPLIKAVEYFVNDTLATIIADKQFPYSSYFSPEDCQIALGCPPESSLSSKHPFAAVDVLAFVLHNVESVIKLLSLAFDYNIHSCAATLPTMHCAPFMGLCADLRVYKEGIVDQIHEVPKECVLQLMNILKKIEDCHNKDPFAHALKGKSPLQVVTQVTILKDVHELIVHMILTDLIEFLQLKSFANYEESRCKNVSKNKIPSKHARKLQFPVSNKNFSKADATRSPTSYAKQDKCSLLNSSGNSGATIQKKVNTLYLRSKLRKFAMEILSAILNAIQKSAVEENQIKDSNVITSTPENDTIRIICNSLLKASSGKSEYKGNVDDSREKSAKQLPKPAKGKLRRCAGLPSIISSEMEQVEKESQHVSQNTNGLAKMLKRRSQILSENKMKTKNPRLLLERVSKLSEHDGVVCINKMCPLVKAAKAVVADTLAAIMADVECIAFLNIKEVVSVVPKYPLNTLLPFSDPSVTRFSIDITETMLKMLSVAFEQAGVFHDAPSGHFMGLCADLWLLKEDVGCLTSLVDVDMPFVNLFSKPHHKQASLTSEKQSALVNTISQHLIRVISKKFASFIQVDFKSGFVYRRDEKQSAANTPLGMTLVLKLYPYARGVSEAIFNLINEAIDEEQQNNLSSGIKQPGNKWSLKSSCYSLKVASSTEVSSVENVGAVEIICSGDQKKTSSEIDIPNVSPSKTGISYNWEQEKKEVNKRTAQKQLDPRYSAFQKCDPSSVFKQLKNIVEFVFDNVIKNSEEESKTPQRCQTIKTVKQIVIEIFQNYFGDLLLHHRDNSNVAGQSYGRDVSAAVIRLCNENADMLVSPAEMKFLVYDVIRVVFQKLHVAFLSATQLNNGHCLEEYNHPIHGTVIIEQINSLCEQPNKGANHSSVKHLFRKEINDKMGNNSNNKSPMAFQSDINRNVSREVITRQYLEEFKHPVHGTVIIEQLNSLCEQTCQGIKQSLAKPRLKWEINKKVVNNSNNKLNQTFQNSQNRNDELEHRVSSPLFNFVTDVLETVINKLEAFAGTEIDSIFCVSNQNANAQTKAPVFKASQQDSNSLSKHCAQNNSEYFVEKEANFSVPPFKFNNHTPAQKGKLMPCHLARTKLKANAKDAVRTLFKRIRKEIHIMPHVRLRSRENTVLEAIVNAISEHAQYQATDKGAKSLKSKVQQNHLHESNFSEVPACKENFRLKPNNTAQCASNYVYQRTMPDIKYSERLYPHNLDHTTYHVSESQGLESSHRNSDAFKPNAFISESCSKCVSSEMEGRVQDSPLGSTRIGRDTRSSHLSKMGSLPLVKEKCFHDACCQNQGLGGPSSTGQVPAGLKVLPASCASYQLKGKPKDLTTAFYEPLGKKRDSVPMTDHSRSRLNMYVGKRGGSTLKATGRDLDQTTHQKDSKRNIVCEQSIAAKNRLNTLLEIIPPHKKASTGGFCQKIHQHQQAAEQTQVNKKGFRDVTHNSQIINAKYR
ncbi:uncharacterized protein LOC144827426 isoform X2 [Lissotriton helveticus]